MRAVVPIGCVLVVFASLGIQAARSSHSKPIEFLYTRATAFEPLAWMRGGERFPGGASIFMKDASGQRVLPGGLAASADPVVSFDASRVLFAGKKSPQDRWQIWELTLADGTLRRVTSCADDCVRPLYLPEDRFVYARKVEGNFRMEAAALEGGKPIPLTYGSGSFMPTDVLRDGRILFGAAYASGSDALPEIYTVYSDGSGVEAYRCDHGRPRHSGRQLASGDVVFATEHGLARFTSALAHEEEISAPLADYAGDVAEMPDGDWLIAARSGAKGRFSIAQWKPGARRMESVLVADHVNVVQPTLLSARVAPNRHPSGLHDWSYANLLCLNAYTSKYSFARNSIVSVRFYTQAASGDEKLLGTSAVERDGSFFVRPPADQPLKIELLDAAGKSLKKEAGWFWLRRGEQRVCVGCHAGPETAPENAVPAVLLRSTDPTDLSGTSLQTTGGH